ncbi:hypothetical protein STEG23_004205 [Scotinomys teguina]
MWSSEDNLESVLSVYHMGPRNLIRIFRFTPRNVYQFIMGETLKVFRDGSSLLFSQQGRRPGKTAELLSVWAMMVLGLSQMQELV